MEAIREKDSKRALEIIAEGNIDLEYKDENGNTALNLACRRGFEELVPALTKMGANVNSRNNKGWTPLHLAAGCGMLETCEMLLDHQTDVNAKDF